ncbi:hypothetical protein GO988_19500 [Hymenobacter sp. HMF4947]|uniref:Glycerophosphoryl diester phosphodiesterase membrane domain-containing protein n=1 Tax=Hymenobacter ginkgonis TaxID=2682976 RepID=A0A7K1TJI6_9BACT|nr:hypothetical protein [Hymenobacter ginkgonis]MVN78523.1 hypothetical protein [Hymenobacter ginkgonis]
MKNTYTQAADFWQERDFGAKISATFEFIGAHWRLLGKCLLYFTLPFSLVMGIGLGFFNNSVYNMSGRAVAAQHSGGAFPTASSPFAMFSFGGLGLAVAGGVLAFLVLSGTLYGYLRARLRLPATEPVTPTDVWAEMRAKLGRMVLASLLLAFGGGLGFSILFGGLVGGIAAVQPGVGATALAFLLVLIPSIYLSIALSLYFPVLWLEDLSILASIGRCFHLIRGQWWATLGLLLIAGFLQSILSIVFAVPQYAVMFGKVLQVPGLNSDVLGLITNCLYATGIIFTYTIPLLALVFQYFNLTEQKDGFGLRLLVDKLGQSQGLPVAQSSHYRPDEEGEY